MKNEDILHEAELLLLDCYYEDPDAFLCAIDEQNTWQ